MFQCRRCESIIPSYYRKCPVCAKELTSKDIHKYVTQKVQKENPEKEKFSAFVESSEMSSGEFTDIQNY